MYRKTTSQVIHFIEIISTGQTRTLRLAEFRSMTWVTAGGLKVKCIKANCLWPLVHFVQTWLATIHAASPGDITLFPRRHFYIFFQHYKILRAEVI